VTTWLTRKQQLPLAELFHAGPYPRGERDGIGDTNALSCRRPRDHPSHHAEVLVPDAADIPRRT